MNEKIITREELIELFMENAITDSKAGWVYNDWIIEIVAIHKVEAKYLQDLTYAKKYKIIPKRIYNKN